MHEVDQNTPQSKRHDKSFCTNKSIAWDIMFNSSILEPIKPHKVKK